MCVWSFNQSQEGILCFQLSIVCDGGSPWQLQKIRDAILNPPPMILFLYTIEETLLLLQPRIHRNNFIPYAPGISAW